MLDYRCLKLALVGSLCLSWLPSCSSSQCDASLWSSIRLHVSDSVTGAAICDASATATKGSSQTTLTASGPPDCLYFGVGEILGTFQISVTKAGYQAAQTTVIVDEVDGCHVRTEDASVSLVPE